MCNHETLTEYTVLDSEVVYKDGRPVEVGKVRCLEQRTTIRRHSQAVIVSHREERTRRRTRAACVMASGRTPARCISRPADFASRLRVCA